MKKNRASFDQYAKDYKDIHNRNIQMAGEDSDYFIRIKVDILAGLLSQIFPGARTPRILDMGCGIGRFEEQVAAKGMQWKITGIDPSFDSLQVARQSVSSFDFVMGDGEATPFRDGAFDVIVMACVLHHVPLDRRAGVGREIARLLKQGGCAVIFEHNPYNPLTRKVVSDCEFDKDAVLISRRATSRWLADSGLCPTMQGYFVFFPRMFSWLRALEKPLLRHVALGGQYYQVAVRESG